MIVAAGCYYDVRTETITNWFTVPVFLLGVLKHFIHDGFGGILSAILGGVFFLALYMYVIYRFCKKLGMGDLKLLFAIGSFAGLNNLGILIPVQFFFTGLALLVYIAFKDKLFNPVAYFKHLRSQHFIEKFQPGQRMVFSPFIGIPFIIYLVTIPILIEVVQSA